MSPDENRLRQRRNLICDLVKLTVFIALSYGCYDIIAGIHIFLVILFCMFLMYVFDVMYPGAIKDWRHGKTRSPAIRQAKVRAVTDSGRFRKAVLAAHNEGLLHEVQEDPRVQDILRKKAADEYVLT